MLLFFFNDTATTEIYTLSLHDALPISASGGVNMSESFGGVVGLVTLPAGEMRKPTFATPERSEEHTSELQSRPHLVCRLLLETKNSWRCVPTLPSDCACRTFATYCYSS